MAFSSDDSDRSGSDDNRFIRFAQHPALNLPNGNWTFQVRIKVIDNVNSFSYPISMNNYHATPSFGGFGGQTSVKMWFQDDGGARYGDTDFAYSTSPGSWILSTFMRRGSNILFFADETNTLDTAHGLSAAITCGANGVTLGCRSDLNGSRYQFSLFSDFAIWRRALTDGEVAAQARGERATSRAEKLMFYEPMDGNRITSLVGGVPIRYGRALQAPDPENLQPLAGIRPTWFLPLAAAGGGVSVPAAWHHMRNQHSA